MDSVISGDGTGVAPADNSRRDATGGAIGDSNLREREHVQMGLPAETAGGRSICGPWHWHQKTADYLSSRSYHRHLKTSRLAQLY